MDYGERCENAFAYEFDQVDFNAVDFCSNDFTRWGWTNGPYPDGTSAPLNIYAGAGTCDPSSGGTFVGRATVTVDGDTVAVKVTPDFYHTFTELHIQVSCDPLKYALQGDTETVTPGQYTYGSDDPTTDSVTFFVAPASGQLSIDGLTEEGSCTSNRFWVIIHAVSCLRPGVEVDLVNDGSLDGVFR